MNRTMGDSTGPAADQIPQTVEMVAGYDTGTPSVIWEQRDWDLFPGKPQVHIDQGYGDTRVTDAHVMVFDVETGAFAPADAERLINANTMPRPTIYVNRSNMAATIASAQKTPKWKGDIWLAFPGWKVGEPLPAIPAGCRYVAIQNNYAGDYDTSVVLDDTWPYVGVAIPVTFGKPAQEALDMIRAKGLSAITSPLRDPAHTYVSEGSRPIGGTIVLPGSRVVVNVRQT